MRVPDYETGCRFKEGHRTKGHALKQAVKRADRVASGHQRLEPYKCVFCGKWHVGKARGKAARRLKPYDRRRDSSV